MSARAKARAAVVVGCVSLGLLAVNAVLAWLVDADISAGTPPAAMLWLIGLAGAPVVGMMIAGRRPGHLYGWLLLSFSLASGLLETTELTALYLLQVGSSVGAVELAGALISQTLWGATIGHLPLLLLLFPDGRLPSRRWRWLARSVVGLTVIASAVALFTPGDLGVVPLPNPFATRGVVATAVQVTLGGATAGIFAAMFPAAASLFVRQRSATPQQRLQLRWFSFAAAVLALALVTSAFAVNISEVVANAITMVGLLGLFGAIGVAVLRYRLYELDRLVSRTVTYGLLTLVVVSVYLATVSALTTVTSRVAGQSPVTVAASTLAAAAAVGPARKRIQHTVDRRFNRARYDAQRTVDRYRSRLRDELDLDALTAELAAAVTTTVQPVATSVWLTDTTREGGHMVSATQGSRA